MSEQRWVLRHRTGIAGVEVAWLQLEQDGVPLTYPGTGPGTDKAARIITCLVDVRHGEMLMHYLNGEYGHLVTAAKALAERREQPYLDMERVPR